MSGFFSRLLLLGGGRPRCLPEKEQARRACFPYAIGRLVTTGTGAWSEARTDWWTLYCWPNPMREPALPSKTDSRLRPMLRFLKRVAIVSFLLVLGITALVAALIAWPAPEPPDRSASGDFVIRNVSVIDVETGTVQPGRDVFLRNGMIESIEPAGDGVLPGDATEIDGSGRYLGRNKRKYFLMTSLTTDYTRRKQVWKALLPIARLTYKSMPRSNALLVSAPAIPCSRSG